MLIGSIIFALIFYFTLIYGRKLLPKDGIWSILNKEITHGNQSQCWFYYFTLKNYKIKLY
jgi:hypothetical protein